MTTNKKIVVVVISVVIVLGLIVALFVGGIVGAVFYGIGNSDAANVSKDFLRKSELLKQDIGEVKDFGRFVTGNININNGNGTAELNLKVIGERKEVNATVELVFRQGRQWRVSGASYRNEAGETVDLMNTYESRKFGPKLVASLFEIISMQPRCTLCLRGEFLSAIANHRATEYTEVGQRKMHVA